MNILEGCRHNGVEHLDLCLVQLGLRRQHHHALLGPPQRGPPGQPLRRHQEGQRADGAHLQPPLPACPPPACASSPSTAPGAGRTWPCSSSPRPSWPASPSTSSTTATMQRDFTYIDDIVEGVIRVTDNVPKPNPEWSGHAPIPAPASAPYGLQHRQPPPGGTAALHRGSRSKKFPAVGKKADQEPAAHAARRRARHQRQRGTT
jgi:UDP-glucuronate 4-epimerase